MSDPLEDALRDQSRRRNGHRVSQAQLRELDTLALLTGTPPPLRWIADGLDAEAAFTMTGGREKSGKSLLQLAISACAASGGGNLAGIAVAPAKTLIIDAENGEREIHRRLHAIGLDLVFASRLIIVEVRGFELREDLDQIVDLIDRHRPDRVVMDSFRSLWRGDEQDNAEVADALDPVRALAHDREVAIDMVHHAQKGGDEYRGSTAIGACVDWVVMLSRVREDEDRTRRKLSNPMARIGRERPDRWLKIKSDDDDGPVWIEKAEPYKRPKPRDEKAQAVLDALTEDTQSVREIADEAGVPKSTADRILKDLKDEKLAQQHPGGWTVPPVPAPYREVGQMGHPGEDT
jgi:hypothetical protein